MVKARSFGLKAAQQRPALRSLPLTVWPLAAFFAFAFSLTAYDCLRAETPPSEAFEKYNALRIHAFAGAIEAGAQGILLIGDSRLRYAVPKDSDFSSLLSAKLGTSTAVLRLTNNWAIWADFAGLAQRIIAAQPRLVVLQQSLFAKERETQGRLLVGRAYLIWRLIGAGPWNPGNLDQAALQDEMRCEVLPKEDAHERKRRVERWVSFDPRGANAGAVAGFVTAAEAAGIDVAVLSIPITDSGRAVLPGYRRPSDRRTIDLGIAMPDENYCDVVHMNEAGRRVFTAALADRLRTRLETK